MNARAATRPTIGLLLGARADRSLLASFLGEVGHPVLAPEPGTLDPSGLDRASLIIVDEPAARAWSKLLIAIKERVNPVVLPIMVALPTGADGASWLRLGFDALLRMPLTKVDLLARIETLLRLRAQSEEALRASEAFSRSALDAIPANVCVVDEHGGITLTNRAWRDFAESNGAPPEAAGEGSNYVAACRVAASGADAEVRDAAAAILGVLEGRDESCAVEYPCHSPAERRWFIASAMRFRSAAAQFTVVSHTNITARRESEIAANVAEQRFRRLTQLSSDWFWEQDASLRFTRFAGGDTEGKWGIEQAKTVGLRRWELPGVSPVSGTWDAHRAMLEAKASFRNFEYQRVRDDGSLQFVSASGEPMFDSSGGFSGYQGVATDITEGKREERLLAMEHAVTRCLSEAASTRAGLQATIRAVCEAKRWDFGRYWQFEEACGRMRPQEFWSVPDAEIQNFIERSRDLEVAPGQGVMGNVLLSSEPAWVADLAGDMRLLRPELLRMAGLRSACVVPIVAGDRTMGVLAFLGRFVRKPDEKLLDALRAIGGQVGQFLQRKKAEAVLRQNNERLEMQARQQALVAGFGQFALKRPASDDLKREAIRILAGKADAVLLVEIIDDQQLSIGVGAGEGAEPLIGCRTPIAPDSAVHEVVKSGISARVDAAYLRSRPAGFVWSDWVRAMGSAALVPVTQNGHAHSVLALYSKRADAFGEEDMRFAESVGHMLSTALQREEAEHRGEIQSWRNQRIADFGKFALKRRSADELVREAFELVSTQAEIVAFFERAPENQIILSAARGEGTAASVGRRALLLQTSAAFRVLDSGQTLQVAGDYLGSSDESWPWAGWMRAMRSGALVPVTHNGHAHGMLAIFSHKPDAISAEQVRFVEAIAHLLSTALQREKAEQRLSFLAQFDSLTELPNRSLLEDRLKQAIAQSRRKQRNTGVLFIDLDRFKLVNDTLGHQAGDLMIREVGRRLEQCVRAGDTVGRISGDEFVIVLADLAHAEHAGAVAQKVLDVLAAPFDLGGSEAFASASIGISVHPTDGEDADALLRNADMAMYKAKKSGRNSYRYFTAQMNERAVARLRINTDLRHAVERHEFSLQYQPKVDLRSGAITGAEALLRWNHPERGRISPADFIPALESSGLILPVGEWVLDEACAQIRRWQSAGLAPAPVAINLSVKQFRRSNLDEIFQRTISAAGVRPELIELEITESGIADDPEDAVRQLRNLRKAGLTIAIDDFGTGYSSLAYLSLMPLSALKIDRSFTSRMLDDPNSMVLVQTMISLAHSLRLQVIAEGVETEEQAKMLRLLRCDQMQGYLFSKPLPPDELALLLARAPSAMTV